MAPHYHSKAPPSPLDPRDTKRSIVSIVARPRWLVVAVFTVVALSSSFYRGVIPKQEHLNIGLRFLTHASDKARIGPCVFDFSPDPVPVFEHADSIDFANHPLSMHRPSNQFSDCSAPRVQREPVVTIVTVSQNPREAFEGTFQSMQSQSLRNFRWVIVDNHSDDATSLQRLERAAKADPRIHLVRNAGPNTTVAARNAGLHVVRSDPTFFTPYVGMLDDDDLLELTTLEKSVWTLESNPQWSIASHKWINFGSQNSTETHGLHSGAANYFSQNYVSIGAIARRHAVVACQFDDTFTDGGEDWDFWLCLAEKGHWGGTLPEFLYWRRGEEPSLERVSQNASSEVNAGLLIREKVQRKHLGFYRDYNSFPHEPLPPSIELEPVTWEAPFANYVPDTSRQGNVMVWVPWLYVGGADIGALRQIEMLTRAGYRVTVVCSLYKPPAGVALRPWVMQWTHDVHVLPSFLRARDFPRYVKYLVDTRDIKMIFFSNAMLAYEMLPALHEKLPGVTFVDYLHNEAYDGWKSGGYPTYSIMNQRYLDRSITCSYYLRNWMIQRGHDPKRIGVVKLGVDMEHIKPVANDFEKLVIRQELYDVGRDVAIILTVARLDPQKRSLLFPHIIKEMLQSHSYSCGLDRKGVPKSITKILMVMVGSGDLAPLLRQKISDMKLEDCFFLAGSQSDAAPFYKTADLFLLPSLSEGISVSVSEAMSAGLPLVVSSAGALPEQIGGSNEVDAAGILIRHQLDDEVDGKLYAEAVHDLISNPNLRQTLGENGKKRVEQSDWHVTLQTLLPQLNLAKTSAKRNVQELMKLPHPAAQLALQTQLHEYTSVVDVSRIQETFNGIRKRPDGSFGRRVQIECGEELKTSSWIDAIENPLSCNPEVELDVESLQQSAIVQCEYWCIWDMKTSERAGWEYNGQCFTPIASSMCENSFSLKPIPIIDV